MKVEQADLYAEIDVEKAIEQRRYQLLRLSFLTAITLILPIIAIRYPIMRVEQPS